jgi:hypothetical protein
LPFDGRSIARDQRVGVRVHLLEATFTYPAIR